METNVGDLLVLFRNAEHIPGRVIRFGQPEIRLVDACARDDCVQLI